MPSGRCRATLRNRSRRRCHDRAEPMNDASRSHSWRVPLLIWGGALLTLVGGVLGVAWWKLPEWQREWVIAHSPFSDPVVRAMLGPEDEGGYYVGARVLDLAPEIGRHLCQRFRDGTLQQRVKILGIAETAC